MEGKDGRTERATQRRRNEERQKGNLNVSPEFTSLGVMLLGLLGLRYAAPNILEQIGLFMQEVTRVPLSSEWDALTVQRGFKQGGLFITALVAPFILPAMLGAVVSNVSQTGPFFSVKTLKWKLSALNPISGVKKLFSLDSVVKLITSLLKIGLVSVTIYLVVRNKVTELNMLSYLSVGGIMSWLSSLVYKICITVMLIFLVIAIIDWSHRKYKYEKNMMMTKQEVKDERKQQEISSEVKTAQKKKMRELTLMRMMAEVPKADVVVTNPTHVAVALVYDPDTMVAPKVVAKGLRLVARRIKRVAKEHGVPVVERPELARGLYKDVKVGHFIPSQFFGAVAEILAHLFRIGKARKRERLASLT